MRFLSLLQDGDTATIISLYGGIELQRRLKAMGLSPGSSLKLLRHGNWSGPVHIRVGTTEIILRIGDANNIIVEKDR